VRLVGSVVDEGSVCKLHNILKGLLGVMNENECWKTKKEEKWVLLSEG
jgi:hypothetical protein